MSARTKPKTVEEILRAHQFKKMEKNEFVCKSGCRLPMFVRVASEVEAEHQAAMLEEAST